MKKLLAIILALAITLGAMTCFAGAAGTVKGFSASASDGKIRLSWSSFGSGVSYDVMWKRTGAESWKKAITTKKTGMTVSGLVNGRDYDFIIRTDGAESPVITASPSASGSKTVYAAYPDSGTVESAADAVANMGAGWNLGNSLDSWGDWIGENRPVKNYETAWGNPQSTDGLMKALKKAGIGAIRVPVTWRQHIDSKGNVKKEWLDRVQEVVDYVVSNGMYCIINVHHDTGTDGWVIASQSGYNNAKDKFRNIWEDVAERFKDYDGKLIFECMNETLNDADQWSTDDKSAFSAIKSYQQLFVDTVRKSGGNNETRNLVVSTYAASSNPSIINSFTLPKDTVSGHLILEVHNYDPQGFTWKNVGYDTERSTWGTDQDKRNMDSFISTLAARAEKLGVPAIVGEFSSDNKNNEGERAKHAAYMYSAAAKKGIRVFWWDNGDPNGCKIIDRSTYEITMPKIMDVIVENGK